METKELYSQWQTQFIDVDDAKLFVASKGSGSPLIFLHGGPGDDSTGLVEWASQFSDQRKVVLFDQRGSGQSSLKSAHSNENISLAKFVSDLEKLTQVFSRSNQPVEIVGHSWGALYAMVFAVERPKLVSKLFLASPGPISEEFNKIATANISHGLSHEMNEQIKKARERRAKAIESGNDEEMRLAQADLVDVLAHRWIFKTEAREEFAHFYRKFHNYDRRVSSILWKEFLDYELQDKMHLIKAKTWILSGFQDYGSAAQNHLMEKRIYQSKLIQLNECGHIPWVDQPAAASANLNQFLKASVPTLEKGVFDPVYLETEHVHIRPLEFASWQKVAEGLLYENSFHARNWGVKTAEDLRDRYVRSVHGYREKRENPIVFLDLTGSEVLGMTNFMNIEPENKVIEIGGTWINPKYQRSYVNTETKFALLQYCFEVLHLHRVEFRIDCENLLSQSAVERLGFHFDGFIPKRRINANGESRDYVFYSVTDKAWPAVKTHIQSILDSAKRPDHQDLSRIKRMRKEGAREQAFSEVIIALKKHPKSPSLNYLAACICDAERTEKEAVPFYHQALECGISGWDRRDTYLGLGSTYRSMGEYKKSKEIFQQGLKEFPDYRPFRVFLALTENNLKNSDEAIRLLLEELVDTTNDIHIRKFKRALQYYSTRLHEVFE